MPTPTPSAPSLPFLNGRFRDFLHRLDRLRRQVAGRAGAEGVPVVALTGGAAPVRAAVAELLAAEVTAIQGEGLDPAKPQPATALALMALVGDATFGDLPGWGRAGAPRLADDHPLPPSGSAGLASQVSALLDATAPQPELAELYLLALAAGAAARVEDAEQRDDLARSRPELARAAAAGHPVQGDLLFPDAYPPPRRHGPARELPAVTAWLYAVPLAATALLAGSYLVWWLISHDLTRAVCSFIGGAN
jgi:hypothetical protein